MNTQTKTPTPKTGTSKVTAKATPPENEILKNLLHLNQLQSEQIEILQRSNKIETDCKNQAYFFILNNGYFDEFKTYATQNPIK